MENKTHKRTTTHNGDIPAKVRIRERKSKGKTVAIVALSILLGLATIFGAITFSKSCIIIMAVFWIYVILSRNNIKNFYKILKKWLTYGELYKLTKEEWIMYI